MPASQGAAKRREGEVAIDASQLRPGVHVRLPVPWLEHQFTFNSFVIADDDQVRQIVAMGLPQVFCDLGSCRVPPLPKPKVIVPPDPATQAETERLAALKARQMAEKVERAKVMNEIRSRLDKVTKIYVGAAKTVRAVFDFFDTNPAGSIVQMAEVSEHSTATLLADPDSAIVLIAEKAHTDGKAAHALAVMTMSLLIGRQAGLPESALHSLGTAALLHDIGKLWINPSILRNAARNRHEEAAYQTHCRIGHDHAVKAGRLAPPILDAILHHHERRDGKGFPDALAGDAIKVAARIVAIANRFDNLTNPIDSRGALSPAEALATMWSKEQGAFDPMLLQLFVRALGVYPPGSIVRLTDGRVGVVVSSAPTDAPLSPEVMIYEPEIPRREAMIVNLAREDSIRIDRPLRLQERPEDELDYLLPRRKLNWFHTERGA